MAKILINDYIDVGTGGVHEATTWQVAKDPDFTKIIDESIEDYDNVTEWHSMLPKLPEDGSGYYADLDMLYARVKIHVNGYTSPWFVLEPKSQNIQDVIITEEGKDDIHTTSEAIGMV